MFWPIPSPKADPLAVLVLMVNAQEPGAAAASGLLQVGWAPGQDLKSVRIERVFRNAAHSFDERETVSLEGRSSRRFDGETNQGGSENKERREQQFQFHA